MLQVQEKILNEEITNDNDLINFSEIRISLIHLAFCFDTTEKTGGNKISKIIHMMY